MTTPTLSQLADIGAKAAMKLNDGPNGGVCAFDTDHNEYRLDQKYREAFVCAVLDAVGYTFPVDPEREAFERWHSGRPNPEPFDAWKAGREELRKEVCSDKCEDTKTEPAWIKWRGGKCPIPDTVLQWEYRAKDGIRIKTTVSPSVYNWGNDYQGTITAYRVLDWGTTKQPE